MTFRKRRRAYPEFGISTPFHPLGATHADVRTEGLFPFCAMMQVAKEDVHRDYVVCRGFDIRMRKFIDYEEGNDDKPGIPVAKPYGKRQTGVYRIGQVFGAFLPTQATPERDARSRDSMSTCPSPSDVDWRVGQNPGVAETTAGHPADLDEAINEMMTDDQTKYVNWMLLDAGEDLIWCMLMEDHPGGYVCFDVLQGVWCPDSARFMFDCTATEEDYLTAIDLHYTESQGGSIPEPEMYAQGWFKLKPLGNNPDEMIAVVVSLDCDSRGECTPALTAGECPETDQDPCLVLAARTQSDTIGFSDSLTLS